MPDLVTLGETMVLLKPFSERGRLKSSQYLSKSIGGAESNVAIGVSRLGHSARWISKLGKDPFGEEILYHLNAEHVDTSCVAVSSVRPTGMMLKEQIRGGDTSVYYYRSQSAASTLSPADIREKWIADARVLHLTGITPALGDSCRDALLYAIEIAKKHQVKISFDPNLRLKLWTIEQARGILLSIAKEADFFFPGLSEARLLLDSPKASADEVVNAFLDMGISQVVVKLGPEGCLYATPNERFYTPGFPVTEVDSVGAGDGFCAGYLAGWFKGWTAEKCARLAAATGALAVTEPGDYEALPTMEEAEHLLEQTKIIHR